MATQKEALKRKMPANAGVVEYKNITGKFEVNLDTIKKYQEKFAAIDKDKNGSVSLDEFISIYGQGGQTSPELSHCFICSTITMMEKLTSRNI